MHKYDCYIYTWFFTFMLRSFLFWQEDFSFTKEKLSGAPWRSRNGPWSKTRQKEEEFDIEEIMNNTK